MRRTWARAPPARADDWPRARSSSASSGMLLQRKNDRRDASSSRSRDTPRPAASVAGSSSTRNTNVGLASRRGEPAGHPSRRCPCGDPRGRTPERRDVRLAHRTPVGAAREIRRQNRPRARRARLVGRRRGPADENAPAARRVAGTGRVEGPGHRQRLHVRPPGGVVRAGVAAEERTQRGVVFSAILRMKVPATNRGPAFTGTRTRSRASVASISR